MPARAGSRPTSIDEQIAQGLRSGNRINRIWDVNPARGGPIIQDRLWVYGSYRHWGTYNTVAGSFKDQDFSDVFYKPSTEQNLFPVWHQSAAARFTAQLNSEATRSTSTTTGSTPTSATASSRRI